jgi:tyrosyl-tRNA synthetase
VPEFSLAEINFPAKLFYLVGSTPLCSSSSEARRQIQGGAVKLDGEKMTDPNQEFVSAAELIGKWCRWARKNLLD